MSKVNKAKKKYVCSTRGSKTNIHSSIPDKKTSMAKTRKNHNIAPSIGQSIEHTVEQKPQMVENKRVFIRKPPQCPTQNIKFNLTPKKVIQNLESIHKPSMASIETDSDQLIPDIQQFSIGSKFSSQNHHSL